MAMIQHSFTSSKWNMGEIFGLKFHIHIIFFGLKKIVKSRLEKIFLKFLLALREGFQKKKNNNNDR